MSDSLKIAALACLLVSWSPMAFAQQQEVPEEQLWVVSCSQDGKLVYRERMSSDQATQRQSSIVHRYPKATCIFIAEAGTPSLVPLDVLTMPIGTPIDDVDLDAALRAITGEQLMPMQPERASLPQPTAPAPLVEEPAAEEPNFYTPPQYETMPGWIRLSTYRTTDVADALFDWNRMVSAYPLAGRYIPSTISTEDGYVMLSVGPVPDHAVEDLCVAAQSMDMDCVPVDADGPIRGYDYLSMFFPGAFAAERNACRWSEELLPQQVAANKDAGRSCWRSPTLVPRDLPLPPSPSREQDVLAEGPPLPRPRPSRLNAGGEDVAAASLAAPSDP